MSHEVYDLAWSAIVPSKTEFYAHNLGGRFGKVLENVQADLESQIRGENPDIAEAVKEVLDQSEFDSSDQAVNDFLDENAYDLSVDILTQAVQKIADELVDYLP